MNSELLVEVERGVRLLLNDVPEEVLDVDVDVPAAQAEAEMAIELEMPAQAEAVLVDPRGCSGSQYRVMF